MRDLAEKKSKRNVTWENDDRKQSNSDSALKGPRRERDKRIFRRQGRCIKQKKKKNKVYRLAFEGIHR